MANLVILPNLVILAILVNLVDLLTPVNLDIMVILLFIGKSDYVATTRFFGNYF